MRFKLDAATWQRPDLRLGTAEKLAHILGLKLVVS
jgi:hypothetical protein